jgi:riboflavin kinase, archaea type
MTVLRGTVASGKSDLAQWMRTYAAAYTEATGLSLYAGSLNVVLAAPYELPADRIRLSASAVGVNVNLVEGRAFGRRVFIFRTDADDAKDPDQRCLIEILSEIRLRDEYGLSDGDVVEVIV